METTPRLCKSWITNNRVETNVIVSHPFNEPIKNKPLSDLFKTFGEIFSQPNLNDYEKINPIK